MVLEGRIAALGEVKVSIVSSETAMGQCLCFAKYQAENGNLSPGDVFPCLYTNGRYVRFMMFYFVEKVREHFIWILVFFTFEKSLQRNGLQSLVQNETHLGLFFVY